MSSSIPELARRYQPVGWFLFFTVSAIFGVWSYFSVGSDITIRYHKQEIRLPEKVAEPIEETESILDSIRNNNSNVKGIEKAITNQRYVKAYIKDTKYFLRIGIENESSSTLQDVRIRVRNVKSLNGLSIASHLFTSKEIEELYQGLDHDDYGNVINVPNIESFPPGGRLVLYVWGDIESPVTFSQPVSAVYNGGEGTVVYSTTISGVTAFIYEYSVPILIFIIILNLLFLASVLEKVESDK